MYIAAFTAAMTGAPVSMAGFIFWVLLCPVLGAFLIFGLVCGLRSGNPLDLQEWPYTLAFSIGVIFVSCGVLIANILDEIAVAIILAATLLFEGLYLQQSRTHA